MDVIIKYWPILSTVLSVLAVWMIWSIRRGLVTRDEWQTTARQADDRLTKLEVRVENPPSREAIEGLTRQYASILGDLREMAGRIREIGQQSSQNATMYGEVHEIKGHMTALIQQVRLLVDVHTKRD